MQKLKLEIESLQVNSFMTSSGGATLRATVRGYHSYDTYWETAPSSVGPNVCKPTDAFGCGKNPY